MQDSAGLFHSLLEGLLVNAKNLFTASGGRGGLALPSYSVSTIEPSLFFRSLYDEAANADHHSISRTLDYGPCGATPRLIRSPVNRLVF